MLLAYRKLHILEDSVVKIMISPFSLGLLRAYIWRIAGKVGISPFSPMSRRKYWRNAAAVAGTHPRPPILISYNVQTGCWEHQLQVLENLGQWAISSYLSLLSHNGRGQKCWRVNISRRSLQAVTERSQWTNSPSPCFLVRTTLGRVLTALPGSQDWAPAAVRRRERAMRHFLSRGQSRSLSGSLARVCLAFSGWSNKLDLLQNSIIYKSEGRDKNL